MTEPAPSPMPTPDLAGLLRRPARPAIARPALAPSPAAAGPAAESKSARTDQAGEAGGRQRRRRQSVAAAEPAAAPGRQYLRSIAVYLPRSLHEQVRRAAAEQGTTATALMLAAVNSTHDQLAAALAETAADDRQDHPGGLFDIPQARRVLEPTVQTTIRVTDAQYEALADLAEQHQVNRSRLITAALRVHFA